MGDELQPAPAWGNATGALHLTGPGTAPVDGGLRALVAEGIHRYGWAFDERRSDLLAGAFTVDACWEASIMGGQQVGPFTGRAEIASWLVGFWPDQADQRRHVFTNVVVESCDGAQATAVAYLILLASAQATTRIETAGFYRFALRCDDDGIWRIHRLFAGFDAPF